MGKGSSRRPTEISEDEFESRWGSIFGTDPIYRRSGRNGLMKHHRKSKYEKGIDGKKEA